MTATARTFTRRVVVIELPEDVATTLYAIVNAAEGDPATTYRQHADIVSDALHSQVSLTAARSRALGYVAMAELPGQGGGS